MHRVQCKVWPLADATERGEEWPYLMTLQKEAAAIRCGQKAKEAKIFA